MKKKRWLPRDGMKVWVLNGALDPWSEKFEEYDPIINKEDVYPMGVFKTKREAIAMSCKIKALVAKELGG